jgi:DNA-binding response OmpR family regulator
MELKILALGSQEITQWIYNSFLGRKYFHIACLNEVTEAISLLKSEKYNLVIVDNEIRDIENTCFRLFWLGRVPVAVVAKDNQSNLEYLRNVGVNGFISYQADPNSLATEVEWIIRACNTNFPKIRVLVIEDERNITEALKVCFRIYWPEAELLCTTEGEDALKVAWNLPMDLILLDLGLPDIPGLEVLKKIRIFSKTPIIILTGSRDQENIVNAIQSGANDYVIKPFRQMELMPRIRQNVVHLTAI